MTSNNEKLPSRIQRRLLGPLPGYEAQREFEAELNFGRHAGPPPDDVREAAVLVLLYPEQSSPAQPGWRIILTQRPTTLPHHGGQICLPGGMLEAEETTEVAALREMHEELGVQAGDVHVLGRLTPLYVWVSNFWVTPWVAWCDAEPAWRPSPEEVDALVALPIGDLLDDSQRSTIEHDRNGLKFSAPCIKSGEHLIWGATSMILGEFKSIIESLGTASEARGGLQRSD